MLFISNTMDTLHSHEIWQQSQCLEHEQSAVGRIYTKLQQQGYHKINVVSHTRSAWQLGRRKVLVSLVDDAWDCARDRSQDTPYLFDADTTVITDNWINTPTVYQVARLPDSFYGIYSYTPANQIWLPDRDFSFGVNRLDFKRMQVLLYVHKLLGIHKGYVNFNCETRDQYQATPKQSFVDQLVHAEPSDIARFTHLANDMPIKNYSIEYDQIHTRSWLNIIVETYSSDNVVALSEKIFRCLVTPVPWIAYSGRYTIARLRSLGFDVLDDIVDHRYDRLIEAHHKMFEFVQTGCDSINRLKIQDFITLQQRCLMAAQHNQKLLAEMHSCWPADFDKWLQAQI